VSAPSSASANTARRAVAPSASSCKDGVADTDAAQASDAAAGAASAVVLYANTRSAETIATSLETAITVDVTRDTTAKLPTERPETMRSETEATEVSLVDSVSSLVTSTLVNAGAGPSNVTLATTVRYAVSKAQPSARSVVRVVYVAKDDGKNTRYAAVADKEP
jgi:hypothetical protein